MKVNGKELNYKDITIVELLEVLDIEKDTVVVEVNKDIIPRNDYTTYMLKEDDKLEIVRFVGGG
jgi:sulfur carrier protein